MLKILSLSAILFALQTHAADCSPQVEGWSSLSTEEKVNRIEQSDEIEYEEFYYSAMTDPELRQRLDEMTKIVLEEAGTDGIQADLDGQPSIFTVGEPHLSFITVYKLNGTTVVYELGIVQSGGATPSPRDQAPPQKHFDSEAEAKAAGMDTDADVSWQVHSYFEANGQPLKIDRFDEGGFSWSGW